VFTVRLPLPAQTSQPSSTSAAVKAQSLRGQRVLVADDNADAAEMLCSFLMFSGHEVVAAADGLQALREAERFRPHVALLDIGMPGLDGYTVAERLRADPSTAPIRLAALTGWGQASDRDRALTAGFDAHFTKPVDLDTLSRWIDGE
jgi:CheY-like chemotaxis protein